MGHVTVLWSRQRLADSDFFLVLTFIQPWVAPFFVGTSFFPPCLLPFNLRPSIFSSPFRTSSLAPPSPPLSPSSRNASHYQHVRRIWLPDSAVSLRRGSVPRQHSRRLSFAEAPSEAPCPRGPQLGAPGGSHAVPEGARALPRTHGPHSATAERPRGLRAARPVSLFACALFMNQAVFVSLGKHFGHKVSEKGE